LLKKEKVKCSQRKGSWAALAFSAKGEKIGELYLEGREVKGGGLSWDAKGEGELQDNRPEEELKHALKTKAQG